MRITETSGVDLGAFPFDRGLTLAFVFLNADGTIYGRFGSRSSKDGMRHVSFKGFKESLRGALELHKDYPANRKSLAGKSGRKPKWGTQDRLPVKPRLSHGGCAHCHNVGDAEVLSLRNMGEPVLDRHLWPYPVPDLFGLKVNIDDQRTIQAVTPGSRSEKVGFREGDKILSVQGQPILSIADIQWVLHNAQARGRVHFELSRGDRMVQVALPLEHGWRRASDASWRVSWDLQGTLAGFICEPLTPQERVSSGLAKDALALRLKATQSENRYLRFGNPAARNVFRKGDIIVGVDGRKKHMKVRQFLAYLLQKKKPGEAVRLTLLRGDTRLEVKLAIP